MTVPPDPAVMHPAERKAEIVALLAEGAVRALLARIALAVPPGSSPDRAEGERLTARRARRRGPRHQGEVR